MMRIYPVRNSVRLILLNDNNELLLMCIEDPRTKSIGEKAGRRFWVTVGGRIDPGETLMAAALRELYEESGLIKDDVKFGPIVWRRELDLIIYGKPYRLKEKYFVARTKKKKVALTKLSSEETGVVKNLSWFSFDQIVHSQDPIYPELLVKHLPNIIAGKYPQEPVDVTLYNK